MIPFRRRLQMISGSRSVLQSAAIAAARANDASFWYITDGFQGVFQDNNGVTPATIGSVIGDVFDQQYGPGVGGGSDMTQGTTAKKPTSVAMSTGHYAMVYDGDAYLTSAKTSAAEGTLIAAFIGSTSTAAGLVSNGGSVSTIAGAGLRISSGAGNIQFAVADGATQISILMDAMVNGTPYVAEGDWDATVGKRAWLNGTAGTPNADVAVDPTAAAVYAIGSRQGGGTGNQFFIGNIALGCVCNTKMPDADRRAIGAFAAYLVGATYT